MMNNVEPYLKYANPKTAAEALYQFNYKLSAWNVAPDAGAGYSTIDAVGLTDGNNRSRRFTPVPWSNFRERYGVDAPPAVSNSQFDSTYTFNRAGAGEFTNGKSLTQVGDDIQSHRVLGSNVDLFTDPNALALYDSLKSMFKKGAYDLLGGGSDKLAGSVYNDLPLDLYTDLVNAPASKVQMIFTAIRTRTTRKRHRARSAIHSIANRPYPPGADSTQRSQLRSGHHA